MNRVTASIIAAGCIVFFSCGNPKPKTTAGGPVSVNLYTVKSKRVSYFDEYPSTTQALSQVNILSNVQGYVTAILAPDGSMVRKGQLLYKIDERLYQAAYDQAVANVRVAEGNQLQAQQDADRYIYLDKYNAVAKQLYDHAIIALQNAKNQTKAAEEALKTAKTNLDYASISAPFDGTIGFSQVRVGNVVSVGQTILNTISTNDPMAVDFVVNEKLVPAFEKIRTGAEALPDSLFTILLPDNSLYPYTGKISVIDRAVDPQTGTIRIRLVFPNSKNELKVGMSCRVRVHNLDTTPQMIVPGKSVIEQMGEYFVYVAKDTVMARAASADASKAANADAGENDNAAKLHAIQRKVQLGQTIGGNVIVLSGINDGDEIVMDGIQSIHDGSVIAAGNKNKQATDKVSQEKQPAK
ncbi:MAG: efflux RND transporter periplasmic adaptor subunit [Chitinophagaceae bacterium]|jgi:membrane fusion protein (multidrug efflux system)|nr:efflux RND transporter periplasmic adaptor subunit [Chitinophagaceae bacterium]